MELREVFPQDARDIQRLFESIGVDKDGAAVMLPKTRIRFFYIKGVRAPAANILKQEALSRGIEAAVSIGVINCSVRTTDVLLWGDQRRLSLLADKLRKQVYGLDRLSRLIERALAEKELLWRFKGRQLGFERPLIMGVVNVTPDSFYDGAKYQAVEAGAQHGIDLYKQGADIIDIGGESTRPGAQAVPAQEEAGRVIPVIKAIRERLGQEPVISVDTYKSEVAAKALEAGADLVNDISGASFDPDMAKVVAQFNAGLIISHIKGRPKDMQKNPDYQDTITEIRSFLLDMTQKAVEAGVEPEAIAIDPGIGFGKRVYDNLLILKKIKEFKDLARPLVIGHSRKSFIGKILGLKDPEQRLVGSVAIAALAGFLGADVLRVHDVPETLQALSVARAIANPEEFLP